ncbi:MAG: trigger factor [Candidatus Omnitrophica bacterium]|nr:trigger factor [Candidatus Omnitrophota bacterium]
MKTEVKKVDNTKREISIEVNGDIVKNKFKDVFERIGKEAKVAGFRPGHVPADILEKNFSSQAHETVLRELIPELYNQALDKEGLDVIDLPAISEVKLDRANLSFKATVEVSPEIPLKNYKGLKVNYKKIEVSPDELKRNVDSLKESRKLESIDDNFARSLGYPDLGELERALERQIFLQKENQQRQKIEHDILSALTRDMNFKLPQPLIERQLQDLLRQAKIDLALKGMPKEKIDEQEKELSARLTPAAEAQVRTYLVLSEIAKKENMPQDEHMPQKVMELLLRQANWQKEA